MIEALILICSASAPIADCQPETALQIIQGPPASNDAMCGFNAQAFAAGLTLAELKEGETLKIVCRHKKEG